MDKLTHELHSFLVAMHTNPEMVNDKLRHFMEHLFSLIDTAEADSIMHYYGILHHEQLSLADIARETGSTQEETLETIDHNLRRLAVAPEWQEVRNLTFSRINAKRMTYRNLHDNKDRTTD